MRTGQAPLVIFALGLSAFSCGPNRPTVMVNIVPPRDGSAIDDLTRIRLIVRRCDEERPTFAADIAHPTAPSDETSTEVEAGVPPNTAFYVWLQGWEACPEGSSVVAEEVAQAGDCVTTGLSPNVQRLVREGCSTWLLLDEGETVPVPLTLGPIAGTCPPTTPGC